MNKINERDETHEDIERLKLALQSVTNEFEKEFDSDEDDQEFDLGDIDGVRVDIKWTEPGEGKFQCLITFVHTV